MNIPTSHRVASAILFLILGFATYVLFVMSSFEGPDGGLVAFMSFVSGCLCLYAFYGIFEKTYTSIYLIVAVAGVAFAVIADGISAGAF